MSRMPTARRLATLVAAASIVSGAVGAATNPGPGVTDLVSGNVSGQAFSGQQALSADGRLVAFHSADTTLVPDDTNDTTDVFVRDRSTGALERVSVASDGAEADNFSIRPSISPDGRFVAFISYATNLVPNDTNARIDVFVHDRETGQTQRVSVGPGGAQADEGSDDPVISADGRVVAFASTATNLVTGDTNDVEDVFVHDRETGTTQRISVGPSGMQADLASSAPAMSDDGRSITFLSSATNLDPRFATTGTQPFVHDRQTGETRLVAVSANGQPAGGSTNGHADISDDGRYVAFSSNAQLVPNATGSTTRVYLRDLVRGTVRQVSVSSSGEQANNTSFVAAISGDGRYVAFRSYASNLVEGSTGKLDIYVHDTVTGTTERASVATNGTASDDMSMFPSIDAEGRHVAFASYGSTLVPGLADRRSRVFVRDRGPALGAFDLVAQRDGDQVQVSGAVALAGLELTSAAVEVPAENAPWSLSSARVAYRPTQRELVIEVGWSDSLQRLLATSAGQLRAVPAESYGLAFEHGGARWEVRALSGAEASGVAPVKPSFTLHRCTEACEEIAVLEGGWGTTGPEVIAVLPVGLLGSPPVAAITNVRAFAGPVPAELSEGREWLELPNAELPATQVMAVLAPAGAPVDDVDFDTAIDPVDGRFVAVLDGSSLPQGPAVVWVRACLGDECRTTSTPVG